MADRYLISGGGTGGGVYPALAVIEALKAASPEATILWMGSPHGPERALVARAGLDYAAVPSGPVVGVGLRAVLSAFQIGWGTLRALRVVRRFRPGALLITGGWATIPAALACWLLRVPILITVPDIEPGAAIRALSRLASGVTVTAEESRAFFPGRAVRVTGYPLRADLLRAAGFDLQGQPLPEPSDTRARALARFGLEPGRPTLLVFGGSRGARSLNHALLAGLPDLLPICQVLHVSGELDAADVQARQAALAVDLPQEQFRHYHTFAYLHGEDMALALAAADLVVSRAGASTLGEFPLFGLPAILVPYPHAWRYQQTNAGFLASRGAAMRLDDDKLTDHLVPLIRPLLTDADQRAGMAAASAALRQPAAAARIAALLADLAGGPTADGTPSESRG